MFGNTSCHEAEIYCLQTLPRLLHMRRKGKSDDHLDILTRPGGLE